MLPGTSSIRPSAGVFLVGSLLGCGEILNPNCADGGGEFSGYAVQLMITDPAGRPAALGTTARLIGSGVDTALTVRTPDESLILIGDEPGRYTVVITRPWWVSQTIENVEVLLSEERCGGIVPSIHDVVLELRPDAPKIRQVVTESEHIRVVSDPPFTGSNTGSSGETQLQAFIEADVGTSTAIDWSSIPAEIGAVTSEGVLTVHCRNSPVDTHVVAVARADPAVFTTLLVTVDQTTLLVCPGTTP